MTKKSPTRGELLTLKKRKNFLSSSRGILEKKLNALVLELKKRVQDVLDARENFSKHYELARRAMALAIAYDGVPIVKIIGESTLEEIDASLTITNIMGVRVPNTQVEEEITIKSPLPVSLRVNKTKEEYEVLIKKGLQLVNTEVGVKRILNEIDSTRRRFNALEKKVIPEIDDEIKRLSLLFEESERESFSKLRLFKGES